MMQHLFHSWRGSGWTARDIGQLVASLAKWKRRPTSCGGARTAVDGRPTAEGSRWSLVADYS